MATRDCYIWDLDGTLADSSHRAHHLQRSPIDWGAYYEKLSEDTPIQPAATIFHSLRLYHPQVAHIIVTMRLESYCKQTNYWLLLHGLRPDVLYMQQEGDHRDAAVVKNEYLWCIKNALGYNPILAFDDHQPIVDMYRANGVPCYQTAPSGKF